MSSASLIRRRAGSAVSDRRVQLNTQSAGSIATAHRVNLTRINLRDTRFQCRLQSSSRDLLASLRDQGQHTPVLLWGSRCPYVIIDGFRRIEALTTLGEEAVLAHFEESADELRAFARSFSCNASRRNLSAYDKANAVWQAMNRWKMNKAEVARLLGLSVRQVNRYLRLLDFDDAIRDALADQRITMADAVALHRAVPSSLQEWFDKIEASRLSSHELARLLRSSMPRRVVRSYLTRQRNGFRLRPIQYRNDMPPQQRQRIVEALESARRMIDQL